jgi:hypothetical protein
MSSVRTSSAPSHGSSELDLQQFQQHIAALELQVSTLRDALRDAQDQSSLFEKQCNWFKKKELELQLSQDRNSSASDLDYLRRRVASGINHFPTVFTLTTCACSIVASYMDSHDPSVIPAIAQVLLFYRCSENYLLLKYFTFFRVQALKMTKDETLRLQVKHRGFFRSLW